jgi:hypothetical protein
MWKIAAAASDFPRYVRWAEQTWKTAGYDRDFPRNVLGLQR